MTLDKQFILTPEEIVFEMNCSKAIVDTYSQNLQQLCEDIAQAQVKKTTKVIHDWGLEPCPHIKSNFKTLKRECPTCWQSLLKGE